jgi:hypothetical protein
MSLMAHSESNHGTLESFDPSAIPTRSELGIPGRLCLIVDEKSFYNLESNEDAPGVLTACQRHVT